MSESHDNTTPPPDKGAAEASSQDVSSDGPVESSIFFATLDEDRWEAWAWTAVGLAASAAVIWAVAYAETGYYSVYAWGVGIPLTVMMALIIMLWGLVKSLLNPPVFRLSRTVAFGLLLGLSFISKQPLTAPVSTEEWTSEHTYRLPFDGDWYTISGGDDLDTNYLVTSPPMRFGYVFTKLTNDGERDTGEDPYDLTTYPCFGADILAPVDATVTRFDDTFEDNVPGKVSQSNMLGNFVRLTVGPQEHVIIANLKQHSVPFEGEAIEHQVQAGDKIGECGNSGDASHPQVKVYAVVDGEKLLFSEGLPLRFDDVEILGEGAADGVTPVGSGDPEELDNGQTVRHRPQPQ